MKAIALILSLVATPSVALAFSKSGDTYATDGSQSDVEAAILDAVAGDVVEIPAGTFTYGAGGDSVQVPKPITLRGAGIGSTIITIAEDAPSGTVGTFEVLSNATVRDFTVNGAGAGGRVPFKVAGGFTGWRIGHIQYNQGGGGYFCWISSGYGLIDNCVINGSSGSSELVFARGPLDAWQTDDTLGGVENVFIEDCTYNGQGYVCDFNSNSKGVVRFCTINGKMKVDGHGKASNTPPRGVRHMEVYHNFWSNPENYWTAIEMRGGTGYVFSNVNEAGSGTGQGLPPRFYLRDYGYAGNFSNFGRFLTPDDYPIDDQIGVGKDPKVAGSEPMYLWSNRLTSGIQWRRSDKAAHPTAIEIYGAEFKDSDLIAADRDFFREPEDGVFDGTSGVGVGTRAEMDAIVPTLVGVGFWVTDEGDWNATNPGPDGRLYTWDGSAWQLKYTPYPYPHPLRAGEPAVDPPPPPVPPAAPTNLRIVED